MIEYKESRHSLNQKRFSDLSLYSAGYEICQPGHHYGPIYRSYELIHFIVSGKGVLEIDGHVFHLRAGDAFFIPSGKISYCAADLNDPWCYTWISFLGINAPMYLYQLMSASRETYLFHHLDTETYRLLIDQILKMKGSAPEESFKGNGLLLQILGELLRDMKFDEQNWEKNCIADEIKFHLDMHYSDKLKRKEVARKFGVHPNYLTRIFREKYDIAPKQYLLHLKLEKACPLLRSTDLPVATIAGSMGFDDAMAFSKLFKKTYGCTPTHFRCAETAPL